MKIKVSLIFISTLILASCNVKTNVNNNAIPIEYKTLEFWNGGAYYDNNIKTALYRIIVIAKHMAFFDGPLLVGIENIKTKSQYIIEIDAIEKVENGIFSIMEKLYGI